jgi:hypothetical protein
MAMGYLFGQSVDVGALARERLTLKYILDSVMIHPSALCRWPHRRQLTHDNIKNPNKRHQPRPRKNNEKTYFTAGANAFNGTMPNPAARTAADWRNAAATRLPTGIASMILQGSRSATFHRPEQIYSRITDIQHEEAHPIGQAAEHRERADRRKVGKTYVSVIMTRTKNHVCVCGNR